MSLLAEYKNVNKNIPLLKQVLIDSNICYFLKMKAKFKNPGYKVTDKKRDKIEVDQILSIIQESSLFITTSKGERKLVLFDLDQFIDIESLNVRSP